jgi:hypothetical protein
MTKNLKNRLMQERNSLLQDGFTKAESSYTSTVGGKL